MAVRPVPSMLDTFVASLVEQHDGRAAVGLDEAAKVVGISPDLAYDLARQNRFPVFGATRADVQRESLRVFIPALVQWMCDGGTRQYDPVMPDAFAPAPPRRAPRKRADWSRLERLRPAVA